jgi:hypothetical protein
MQSVFPLLKSPYTILLFNDIIQVSSSVADVIIDILVLFEFQQTGKTTFFYLSIAVFFLAQITYALLFTYRYGWNLKKTHQRFICFCCAFIFGQLFPLFTFIESFNIKRINTWIRWLGLTPTNTINFDNSKDNETTTEDENDQLWSLVQKKYQSHFGFLCEAIVEALPQSILQTTCVVIYGNASLTITCSIALSCFVIITKTYLLCFSIHMPSFIFNTLCVTSDVTALFAGVIFAFSSCSPYALKLPTLLLLLDENNTTTLLSSLEQLFWEQNDRLFATYFLLAITSSCFLILSGMSLVSFTCCDDHIKYRRGIRGLNRPLVLATNSPSFDIYFIRFLEVICSCIPASVIVLCLKMSLIPLFMEDSIDLTHYDHPQAMKKIYGFIRAGGKEFESSRIMDLNQVIRLLNEYSHTSLGKLAMQNVYSSKNLFSQAFDNFARMESQIGFRRIRPGVYESIHPTNITSSAADQQTQKQLNEEKAREQARILMNVRNREKNLNRFESRSIIYRWLHRSTFENKTRREEFMLDDWICKFLRIVGVGCLGLTLCFGIIFIPVFLLASVMGSMVPYWGAFLFYREVQLQPQQQLQLSQFTNETILGFILTSISLFSLVGIIILWSHVSKFQKIARDLERFDKDNVSALFFRFGIDLLLKEAYRRHREKLGRKALQEFLDKKFGQDVCNIINEYLAGEKIVKEGF